MTKTILVGLCGFALLSAQVPANEPAIVPGIGVPGMIELGWSKKEVFAHLGRTRERKIQWRGCVRWTEHRLDYSSRGFYADLDREADFDTTRRTERLIDHLSFDTTSHASVSGLRIGKATRGEVYSRFGFDPTYRHSFSLVTHNPSSSYDTLGVDFVFDCNLRDADPLNERLIQVDIYAPRVH